MTFSKSVNQLIAAINEALAENNINSRIDDTQDFHLDEVSHENLFSVKSATRDNRILIELEISPEGIKVGLDGHAEVLSWGRKLILGNLKEFKKFIADLFTQKIEVINYGEKLTTFQVRDSSNKCLRRFRVYKGLFFLKPWPRVKTAFAPFYSKH